MLILFDFKCDKCQHVEEKLVHHEVKIGNCSECHGKSLRMISPVRSQLEGISGHFPDAADKWAKSHETEGRKPSESNPSGW